MISNNPRLPSKGYAHAAADPLQRAKNKPMLRIPLRNSVLVLQFDTLEDRDAVVDTLTPLAQQVQSKGKRPAVSDQLSGPPALVAIKKKLLTTDRSDMHAITQHYISSQL